MCDRALCGSAHVRNRTVRNRSVFLVPKKNFAGLAGRDFHLYRTFLEEKRYRHKRRRIVREATIRLLKNDLGYGSTDLQTLEIG
jgi:hypothetical protein